MDLKKGMLPWRPEAFPLRMESYLVEAALPAMPAGEWGHVGTNSMPWGMLGNDRAGCCVSTGFCHQEIVWAHATGRPLPPFDDQVALANYSRALVSSGGRPYDPRDPSTDRGLDPGRAAMWWQDVGLTDAAGKNHRIKTFVTADGVEQLQIGGYLFGCTGCGFNLPDNADAAFSAGEPWDDISQPPNPRNGHYVPLVGGNSRSMLMFVTWGGLQAASKRWVSKYLAGGVVQMSRAYLLATGKTPEALDEPALDRDILLLRNS